MPLYIKYASNAWPKPNTHADAEARKGAQEAWKWVVKRGQRIAQSSRLSALNVSFRHALAQQFQASLGKIDNLAFVIIVNSFGLRLDLSFGNLLDHIDDFVRFSNLTNQRLVLGFE